jgi:hypothetical protein
MWRRVARYKFTDVSMERTASIFSVQTSFFLLGLYFDHKDVGSSFLRNVG